MRRLLLIACLLAGCSKDPDADAPTIAEARSLGAEWALVNEQSAQGKLTTTYADTMHEQIREQLQTAAKSLTQPDSSYGREMHALLAEPDGASPEQLRAHSDKLKQIEDALESA